MHAIKLFTLTMYRPDYALNESTKSLTNISSAGGDSKAVVLIEGCGRILGSQVAQNVVNILNKINSDLGK